MQTTIFNNQNVSTPVHERLFVGPSWNGRKKFVSLCDI